MKTSQSILHQLITQQKEYLNAFFNSLNVEKTDELLELLKSCKGTIHFTGVGKSGIIAEKLSKTFVSIGIRAYYLSPLDALHGDLGLIGEGDLCIFLSKSGETIELIELSKIIKRRQIAMISWVSVEHSTLACKADLSIYLPLQGEICPHDLAPTISTTIQMLFGDLCAVALMRQKNFSVDEFAQNHPGGSIGWQIATRIKDLMLTGDSLPICKPTTILEEGIIELSNKRCGVLLITDEAGNLLGLFTDGDLRRALQKGGTNFLAQPLSSLMTRDYLFVTPEAKVQDALKLMQNHPSKKVMMLPVLEEKKLAGLIHMHDLVKTQKSLLAAQ